MIVLKKIIMIFFFVILFCCNLASAEEVYCGNLNGKPAYVDTESIEQTSTRSSEWIMTSSGIYPKYYHSYIANIFADELWYKVYFRKENGASYMVSILDKNKKDTYKYVHTLKFDFAFPVVEQYYPEAQQKRNEIARKNLEESDRQAIEQAKRNK